MDRSPSAARSQFIRINRGISQFNNDYYAALGLPIISSPIYIRHVYVSIARILHPDIYGFTSEQKELATQYLAKLVNPAYNILMKEEERKAYQGIFQLLAKRLMQKSRNIPIYSSIACELMQSPSDGFYERAVSAIAKVQFQSLDLVIEYTAQISELNLVYILYKEGYRYDDLYMPPVLSPQPSALSPNPVGSFLGSSATARSYTPNNSAISQPSAPTQPLANQAKTQPPSAPIPSRTTNQNDSTIIQSANVDNRSIADRMSICEVCMSQGNWKVALKELREVLQIEPNNSKAHAMLGVVYKNINQPQMAKISLMRSLQINPNQPLALKHIQDLQKSTTLKSPSEAKPVIAPPQQRNWLGNLLGWINNDEK
jgi:curved DNA-binding protein CbpA